MLLLTVHPQRDAVPLQGGEVHKRAAGARIIAASIREAKRPECRLIARDVVLNGAHTSPMRAPCGRSAPGTSCVTSTVRSRYFVHAAICCCYVLDCKHEALKRFNNGEVRLKCREPSLHAVLWESMRMPVDPSHQDHHGRTKLVEPRASVFAPLSLGPSRCITLVAVLGYAAAASRHARAVLSPAGAHKWPRSACGTSLRSFSSWTHGCVRTCLKVKDCKARTRPHASWQRACRCLRLLRCPT